MLLAPRAHLLCTGDSITDAGRSRPLGLDVKDQLGDGWVARLAELIAVTCPERRIRISNSGVGGNSARELAARWEEDVVAVGPTWLALMLGINDCARAFSRPCLAEAAVPAEEFHATLDRLLGGLRPALDGLILLTPFYVEAHRGDALRQALEPYQQAMRDLAGRHRAILVDTQAVFDRLLAHDHPDRLAPDRVHPRRAGHLALALAVARAIGLTC